jgi:YggT family protein
MAPAACSRGLRWLHVGPCRRAASRRRANPEATMNSLISLIVTVIQIYIYVLVASAILSWLIAFNVVNTRNQFVAMLAEALWRLTEPALRPIRRFMPNLGGLDLSPVVLILLLIFAQNLILEYFWSPF